MHPIQERLAKKRRKNMPGQEAVMLLLQDTDLETEEDVKEWLQIILEKRPSFMTEPGCVDYDQLLERAKDGATRDLWLERNKYHPVPFAARHIAKETGVPYADALDHLRGMVGVSLYFHDQHGDLMAHLFPGAMPLESWDNPGLLIDVYEFVRILSNDGIAMPSGWPEWLQLHASDMRIYQSIINMSDGCPEWEKPSYVPKWQAANFDMAGTEEESATPKPDESTGMIATPSCTFPIADPPEQPKDDESTNRPPDETPRERENRLLEWAKEEFSLRGKIGTVQRVAKREKTTRQMITRILKRFTEGRKFLDTLNRA